jgi:peptidoglycan hydrolase-like protein with peptidoglycan-binding domain
MGGGSTVRGQIGCHGERHPHARLNQRNNARLATDGAYGPQTRDAVVVRVFSESARLGAQSPELMRAMLWTRLGRRARSSRRRRRVESITAALAEVTSYLPAAEARRREGAIVCLASLPAWITVSEECGLSAEDAQRGIAWAIETLIAALRRDNQAHDAKHLSQGGDHHDRDDSD